MTASFLPKFPLVPCLYGQKNILQLDKRQKYKEAMHSNNCVELRRLEGQAPIL